MGQVSQPSLTPEILPRRGRKTMNNCGRLIAVEGRGGGVAIAKQGTYLLFKKLQLPQSSRKSCCQFSCYADLALYLRINITKDYWLLSNFRRFSFFHAHI